MSDFQIRKVSDNSKEGHKLWIDCVKFFAILAVVIDHSFQKLYDNVNIMYLSYFSVTVFIFLSGMTSLLSWRGRNTDLFSLKILWSKVKKILIPYAIATMIYLIASSHYINMKEYLYYFVNFNISGPFYFVLVYIQLILVSPILLWLIEKYKKEVKVKRIIAKLFFSLTILLFSVLSIHYTSFSLDIYRGGQNLLGGTYLFIYFLGMLFAEYKHSFKSRVTNLAFNIVFTVVWIGFGWFLCRNQFQLDKFFPFGNAINPPGLSLMIYGLLTIAMLYGWILFLEKWDNKYINMIISGLAKLGKKSLYIFLYHRLLLDYILSYLDLEDIWLRRIVYILTMVGVPVLLVSIWDSIKKNIVLDWKENCYKKDMRE